MLLLNAIFVVLLALYVPIVILKKKLNNTLPSKGLLKIINSIKSHVSIFETENQNNYNLVVMFVAPLTDWWLIEAIKKKLSKPKLPPGPRGIPFLGNLLQLGTAPHLKFCEWAKEFGKLYMIKLGGKPALVVNDANLIRKLFGRMASTGRMKTELMVMISEGCYGIGNSEGYVWQEQMQFFLKTMKSFGYGENTQMKPRILLAAQNLTQLIENELRQNDSKVNLDGMLANSLNNVLWSMITGEWLVTHDSKIVLLLNIWIKSLNAAARSGVIFFSWIKYISPVQSGYLEFRRVCKELRNYVKASFQYHKRTRICGEPPRDMIDAYIDKVENCVDPNSSFYGNVGWKHSFGSIAALMLVGGSSTGNMIHWIIFYLTAFPAAQKKLQKEIDRMSGEVFLWKDKKKMPYMEAVIFEVMRMSAVAPFGVMQELLESVDFHGYTFSKGTVLVANLYHVHYDRSIWGDPETFRPERFLNNTNGNTLKDFVIAFQPGKRSCPGEHLAKDIMFIFTTKLFHKFSFSKDPSVKYAQDYLEPIDGIGLLPKKLSVIVQPRKKI